MIFMPLKTPEAQIAAEEKARAAMGGHHRKEIDVRQFEAQYKADFGTLTGKDMHTLEDAAVIAGLTVPDFMAQARARKVIVFQAMTEGQDPMASPAIRTVPNWALRTVGGINDVATHIARDFAAWRIGCGAPGFVKFVKSNRAEIGADELSYCKPLSKHFRSQAEYPVSILMHLSDVFRHVADAESESGRSVIRQMKLLLGQGALNPAPVLRTVHAQRPRFQKITPQGSS